MAYYCNIRFPYKIKKTFMNIPINILDQEGKKLLERFSVSKNVSVLGLGVFVRYFLGIVGILRFSEFFHVVDSSQYFDTPILSLCFQE